MTNRDTGDAPRPEQTFFTDPALDRVLGVVWSLATEVYVLRDRVGVLEQALARNGTVDLDALQQEADPDDLNRQAADRDAFVRHLMEPLAGLQASRGALR